MKLCWLLMPLFFVAANASALEIGAFNLDAHALVGSNVNQGTFYGIGADFYTHIEDRWAVGVGGFYTMGQHPSQDRVIGAGPFTSYGYPITSFLIASAREDLDYVDERSPFINTTTNSWDYNSYSGMMSITTLSLGLYFTQHFGVSVGYQIDLGLNSSSLGQGESGFIFGLMFSI